MEIRHDLERDLHDKVAIGMSAIAAHLDLLSSIEDSAARAARIAAVQEALRQAIDDVRYLGKTIYPPTLGGGQLEPTLQAVAEQRGLPLGLDLPAHDLRPAAEARVGLLVADHLNRLIPGTMVQVRVRGRRLVRVRIAEGRLGGTSHRTYRAWSLCG